MNEREHPLNPHPEEREIRRLSPEECRHLAESFSDLPPEYQLSAADLEMIQDEVFGPQRYGTADAAVDAMARRLNALKAAKAQTLTAMENALGSDQGEALYQALLEDLDSLNRLIEGTQARLDHSRFQKGQEN